MGNIETGLVGAKATTGDRKPIRDRWRYSYALTPGASMLRPGLLFFCALGAVLPATVALESASRVPARWPADRPGAPRPHVEERELAELGPSPVAGGAPRPGGAAQFLGLHLL